MTYDVRYEFSRGSRFITNELMRDLNAHKTEAAWRWMAIWLTKDGEWYDNPDEAFFDLCHMPPEQVIDLLERLELLIEAYVSMKEAWRV